jgi:hypothetical protein
VVNDNHVNKCIFVAGCWIVSTKWLKDSIRDKRIMNEVPYEVRGSVKASIADAPRRAREYFEQVSTVNRFCECIEDGTCCYV